MPVARCFEVTLSWTNSNWSRSHD